MEKTVTEVEEAIHIANSYLENVHLDPDGHSVMLSRQFLRAIEREMELKHRLDVILPMAKGYAFKDHIRPNVEKVIWAEEYLNQLTEKNPYPSKSN